jgi:hypothetical protein
MFGVQDGIKDDCMKKQCAWYDDVDLCCCMITIADNLSLIERHLNKEKAEATK